MRIHAERKSNIAEAASAIQNAIRSTQELSLRALRYRANVARRTRARSAAASIVLVGTVKLFAMIEKTSVSPLAASTYPAIARTLSTVPVFALTLPSAAVPASLLDSVPSRPVTGSVSANAEACLGSERIRCRMPTSALDVT
jgi:hypothetical protein